MPLLSVVETPSPELEERQGDEAWRRVLAGIDEGLTELHPRHPERPYLLECRREAAQAAREPARSLRPLGGAA